MAKKPSKVAYVPSEDSAQPEHAPSPISVPYSHEQTLTTN